VRVRPEVRAAFRLLFTSLFGVNWSNGDAVFKALAANACDAVSRAGGDLEHFGGVLNEVLFSFSFLLVIFLNEFLS